MRVLIEKYDISNSRFFFLLSTRYSINDNIRYLSLSNINLPFFLLPWLIQRKRRKEKMKRCTMVLLHFIVSSYDSSIDDRKACSMFYFIIFEERNREEAKKKDI